MKSFLEEPDNNPDDFLDAHDNRSEADWDKLYANYDACVDWTSAAFYLDFFKKYPNAEVILIVRDIESWYESVKKTIHQNALKQSPWKEDHPNYPFYRVTSRTILHGLIADPQQFEQKEMIKRFYDEHTEEVKRVIPAENLLVMRLGLDSNWETLCKFLDKPIPVGVSFPKRNNLEDFSKYFAPVNANIE